MGWRRNTKSRNSPGFVRRIRALRSTFDTHARLGHRGIRPSGCVVGEVGVIGASRIAVMHFVCVMQTCGSSRSLLFWRLCNSSVFVVIGTRGDLCRVRGVGVVVVVVIARSVYGVGGVSGRIRNANGISVASMLVCPVLQVGLHSMKEGGGLSRPLVPI